MKIKLFVLILVLLSGALSACQSAPTLPTPTATALPTNTPEPTAIPTMEPTATIVPEIGKPISSENWELTLIGISLMEKDVYDQEVNGSVPPNEGDRYVALGFKVKPLGEKTSVVISEAVVIDENGQTFGAYYLGNQDAVGEMDPFSIDVKRCVMMAVIGESIDISAEQYFHMIFQVPETSLGKQVTFKFDDVPAIPFIVE